MTKKLMMLVAAMVIFGGLAWAKVVTGVVSDTNCGLKHSKAGDEATACIKKCEDGGAKLVLVSHGKIYMTDDQDKLQGHEGHLVKVTGTITGDKIAITDVSMAGAMSNSKM